MTTPKNTSTLDLVDYTANDTFQKLAAEEIRLTNLVAEMTKQRDKVRAVLQKAIGDRDGLQVGDYIATYEPVNKYREAGLRKDLPDLTDQFVEERVERVFNLDRFVAAFPDVASQYQSRAWKVIGR